MENERRYGTCQVCKENRMLESVLGSYHGQPWAGWMCQRCYEEIRDKRNGKEGKNDQDHDNR